MATLFRKLQAMKDLDRGASEKHRLEHPFPVNMLNAPKLLENLHETTFIIFYHYP